MYVIRLEQNELQLVQVVLANANLNMEQSNLRGQLWTSLQNQLQSQMPTAAPAPAGDGEGGEGGES